IDDGTKFMQIALCDHEASRMLPQLTRKAYVLKSKVKYFPQMRVFRIEAMGNQLLFVQCVVPMAADHSGQPPHCVQRKAHCFGYVADGSFGTHLCHRRY